MKKIFGYGLMVAVLAVAGSAFASDDYVARKEIKDLRLGKIGFYDQGVGTKTDKIVEKTADAGVTIDGLLIKDGAIATEASSTTAVDKTLTSADYGTTVYITGTTTNTLTLPANGAAIGSWIEVANGAGTADTTVTTIAAATADTLVGPNDPDLDSVTWASGHRINARAKFISDGAFWHVLNFGGTTMTYTD